MAALGAAAGACGAPWPALVPVHDPLRDAYWGVGAAGGASVHLDSDSVHVSQPPDRLMQAHSVLDSGPSALEPHSTGTEGRCKAMHAPPAVLRWH